VAHCWEAARGFAPEVESLLATSDLFHDCEFLVGFPEYKVPLPGGRRESQTDLMVLTRSSAGLVVIAVEAKVDEPFGEVFIQEPRGPQAPRPGDPH
jgi:Domain of unknown function (DUF6946)